MPEEEEAARFEADEEVGEVLREEGADSVLAAGVAEVVEVSREAGAEDSHQEAGEVREVDSLVDVVDRLCSFLGCVYSALRAFVRGVTSLKGR